MRARTYHDSDADLDVLTGRTVAVVGYGNQGCAQAQNLRDSRVRVVVGNRDDDYRARAVHDGFEVLGIDQAARAGRIVLLLIPDEVQAGVVAEQIAPGLGAGDTLVVASGYNLAFGLLDLPADVDVVMVAPRMIGEAVRDRYLRGAGYPCLVSVERDVTGTALATALAVARGIGATAAGAIESSAREEAALDLFSEQAIWPTVFAVLQASYEVLADAGFSDEAILDEMYLSGEPAEVFARISEMGLLEQLRVHSRTSQYGQLLHLERSAELVGTLRDRFARILRGEILSGRFAAEWSAPGADTESRIRALLDRAGTHPLIAAERAVRARG
ncbi:NAD(P)-binding domain-containing protein [Pseudonocardia asaccharolytica]|uniref:Ketol-acid reductoisomerase type 1 n=1 Tax=Pseudonocardia asaccharolytica DSM 44247 = NBRC 16224 TaxID=1123024 RepID=A0A511CWI1_9PSEU|nr:NAD(P)-binding domain-containing protein [Pseudonocardia asaccharolytica]GEL16921.1 ketol-acid reductoisomerase (NADP(+)) [Pseudonocardia asaccharolytica DSM 44247 = NBRC 16224]